MLDEDKIFGELLQYQDKFLKKNMDSSYKPLGRVHTKDFSHGDNCCGSAAEIRGDTLKFLPLHACGLRQRMQVNSALKSVLHSTVWTWTYTETWWSGPLTNNQNEETSLWLRSQNSQTLIVFILSSDCFCSQVGAGGVIKVICFISHCNSVWFWSQIMKSIFSPPLQGEYWGWGKAVVGQDARFVGGSGAENKVPLLLYM